MGLGNSRSYKNPKMTASKPATTLAKDPVCGMNVNPATAKHSHQHRGLNYYFCCAPCGEKFKANPEKYLNQPAQSAGLVCWARRPLLRKPQSRVRMCMRQCQRPEANALRKSREQPLQLTSAPWCPAVRTSKPGVCPSCGMALEPDVPIASTRTEYTCPMHPRIVRKEPGSCPICGMALEPRTVTATEEENPELARPWTRRFWISALLTAPLLFVRHVLR